MTTELIAARAKHQGRRRTDQTPAEQSLRDNRRLITQIARHIRDSKLVRRPADLLQVLEAAGVRLELLPDGSLRVWTIADGINRRGLAEFAQDWIADVDNARRARALLAFIAAEEGGHA